MRYLTHEGIKFPTAMNIEIKLNGEKIGDDLSVIESGPAWSRLRLRCECGAASALPCLSTWLHHIQQHHLKDSPPSSSNFHRQLAPMYFRAKYHHFRVQGAFSVFEKMKLLRNLIIK